MKSRKQNLCIVLFLLFSSISIAKEGLKILIEEQIQKGEFVGVSIGSYDEKTGSAFYGFGSVSTDSSVIPSRKHIFEIGSISKVFTGILLASLHIEGKVKMEDKLELYLPELKGFVAGKIKLVDLSTHMSGLARLPNNLSPQSSKDPYANYGEKELISYLKSLKLIKKPSRFSWNNYSNLAVGLLAYVLQKVTNKSYDELIYKYIAKPLGMVSTAKNLKSLNKKMLVNGHDELLVKTPYWEMKPVFVGAGALKSTTEDMLKFIKGNLNPEKTSIAEALKLAQKPQEVVKNKGIALGWGVKLKNKKVIGIGHNGGTGGFVSNLQISLEDKIGVISLTNTANDPQCIIELLLKHESCSPQFARKLPKKLLKEYVGTYKNIKSGITFILSSHYGQLVYEIPGQEKGKTTSINDKEFSIKGIASMKFLGKDSFLFKQGGVKLVFNKLVE